MAINPAIVPYNYDQTKKKTTTTPTNKVTAVSTNPTNQVTATSNPTTSQNVYNTVKKNKPDGLSVYNPEFKPGEMYDMSRYSDAIGDGPRQFQTPQATTQRQFTLEDLQSYLNNQQQAGSTVPVGESRFQNTDQLMQLIQTMVGATNPLADAQSQAANQAFNQNLQKLQSSWASRGLGASGAAASQERQAVGDLAQEQARIKAQQQADAISLALQYAGLGLQEDAQKFAQNANNRDFEQNRSRNAFQNLLNSLTTQEGMRQFEQTFGLDVERLKSQEMQNYLNQLANLTQMGMQDNQWSQEFGLERQAQDFNRWLQTQILNSDNQNNWMSNLISAGGQASNYDYLNRQLDEQQRQNNIGNAIDLSKLFGIVVQPKSSGYELFNQLQGMNTLDRYNTNLNAALQLSEMFGFPVTPQNSGANLFAQVAGNSTLGAQQLALQRMLATMGGGGSGGGGGYSGGGGSSADMIGSLTENDVGLLMQIRGAKTRSEAEALLRDFGPTLSASGKAHLQSVINSKFPTASSSGSSGGGGGNIFSKIFGGGGGSLSLNPTNEYGSGGTKWDFSSITDRLGFSKDNPNNVWKWPF